MSNLVIIMLTTKNVKIWLNAQSGTTSVSDSCRHVRFHCEIGNYFQEKKLNICTLVHDPTVVHLRSKRLGKGRQTRRRHVHA